MKEQENEGMDYTELSQEELSRIVEDVLNGFKKKSVIADALVVCDESNNFYKGNQDHLFVHILIKPSATVDYYPLWLKVAPLGLMNPPLVAQYIEFIAEDGKYFGASE